MRINVIGNMPEDRKRSIYAYATRQKFLDHNDQFTVAGSDEVKTMKAIHVEPGERGQPGAVPAYGEEGETYVLIRLEDQNGERHRLTDCSEVIGIRHVPGILYHDPIMSQTWVIPLTEQDMTSEEVPDLSSKTPVRLHGAAPSAVEDMGPIPDEEWISEGEFYISDEDSPVLIAVAWQSEVGVYTEGFETPEKLSKDEALKAAVRQRTADLDTSFRM